VRSDSDYEARARTSVVARVVELLPRATYRLETEGRQQVLARHVRVAAADTPEARRDWAAWGWGIAALATAVAAIGWMMWQ